MIRRILAIMTLAVGFALSVSAQCSIDKIVEDYSAVGRSKFTSAVERDPKTRKVVKVVKVLELNDYNGKQLIAAFEQEAKRYNSALKTEGGKRSGMFHIETDRQHRIYTLLCEAPYSINSRRTTYEHISVTIIIKYK